MKVTLARKFRFEASHSLSHLPDDHPCHNLHGHSYALEIEVSGEVDEDSGFLLDYAEIKKAVQPLLDNLDHKHLNDVDGLEKPTTELIARWLWNRIKPALPQLSRIAIQETPTTRCEYKGR
jgi:6-pyruvoyltetrahydropterin/6-carboxytetrahydropterin synthase